MSRYLTPPVIGTPIYFAPDRLDTANEDDVDDPVELMISAEEAAAIPTSVEVCGRRYTVRFPAQNLVEDGLMGAVQHGPQTIEIAPDQVAYSIRDTLLHEVLHAVEHCGALRLKEHQVAALATLLLDTLRRNPVLTRFLVADVL